MGCNSSVDVVSRIKEQDKKIDNLIEINQNLQKRLNELNSQNVIDGKINSDTNDLTYLKSTIDSRFTKLEKNVEKIHNDFKVKLFEGINDGAGNGNEHKRKESISLNFDKENAARTPSKVNKEVDPNWNELLYDSNMTPQRFSMGNLPEEIVSKQGQGRPSTKNYVDHNEIHMEFENNAGARKK